MKELDRPTNISLEQHLQEMSLNDLWERMRTINQLLAQSGVKTGVAQICWGAGRYGHAYEDRRYRSGATEITPLNSLMAVLHNQPDLHSKSTREFEHLVGVVADMAMTVEALFHKTGPKWTWPDEFIQPPQMSQDTQRS